MKRTWIAIAMIGLAAGAGTLQAQESALPREQRMEDGKRAFFDQGCYGCHTLGKIGTPIGPDLSHVGAKLSEAELKMWLRDPSLHRPAARMPQLELTEPQIAALASFLKSLD